MLVEHLDYTKPLMDLTLASAPSIRAVIKIGNPSVPKLVEVLFAGKPSTRGAAAIALGQIGGEQAKEALNSALRRETESTVIDEIKNSLSLLSAAARKGS